MKRVIQFTKARYIAIAISIVILAAGAVGTVLKGGFDMGIDYQAGLNLRVQVASPAFTVLYTGEGDCNVNISGNAVTVETRKSGEEKRTYSFPFPRMEH